MGRFTVIPQSTFEEMQMDAGVLLKTFNPASPSAPADEDIICATTGGIQVTCAAEYSDLGEDVDNCPNNMKELKHLDSWDCGLEFTSLGTSAESIRLALGAADITSSSGKIVPRRNLEQTDFADVWWVGDRADGGLVAVKLINALSVDGFSLQTTKNGKGQVSVNLRGHVSIDDQDTMPMEFYSLEGSGLDSLNVTSFGGASSGKTSITVSGHVLASGESYKYKLGSAPVAVEYEDVLSTGWTAWNGSDEITATTGQIITVAVVTTSDNKAQAAGHVMVTSA